MFKKIFFPHKKNNHHPYALRPMGLLIAFCLIVLFNSIYNYAQAKELQVLGYATDISTSQLYGLGNQERTSRGLKAYAQNSKLASAAYRIAQDMFAKDYWSHYDPSGTPHWHFISEAGYSYGYVGENLAKDFNSSSGVVAAWMASSTHRANMLSTKFVDVGYAAVNGKLSGSKTTLVVGIYAKPQSYTPPPLVTKTPSSAPSQTNTSAPAPTQTTPSATEATHKKSTKPKTATKVKAQTKPKANLPTPEVKGESFQVTPAVIYSSLNWSQKATIMILATLILVNLMKHTLVWRSNKRGLRHIWLRSHPLVQAGMLSVILIAVALSGVGVVQ